MMALADPTGASQDGSDPEQAQGECTAWMTARSRKDLPKKEQPGGGSGYRRPGFLDHGAGSSDPGMAQRISRALTILPIATSARAIARSQRPMARPTSRVEWLP